MGRTLQIIALLADRGSMPGLTRGEIREALGLPPDAEITARIREAQTPSYGEFDIRCDQYSKTEWRYWMPVRERARAKRFIAERTARIWNRAVIRAAGGIKHLAVMGKRTYTAERVIP